jgi:predicted nucleic acid-binding protein
MADVVVDASVWVSRMVPGDVHHERCRAWFEAQTVGGDLMVSPVLLLPEVAAAISRRTGQPRLARRAVDLLQELSSVRLVSVDPALAKAAAQLAADHALRGADAVYAATAQHLGLSLVTLDGEQLERAQAVVSTLTP